MSNTLANDDARLRGSSLGRGVGVLERRAKHLRHVAESALVDLLGRLVRGAASLAGCTRASGGCLFADHVEPVVVGGLLPHRLLRHPVVEQDSLSILWVEI